jgi:hypothetical protein
MTIDQMIEHLQELKERGVKSSHVIRAWCPEGQDYYPVTGMNVCCGQVDLYTDADEEAQS